MIIVGVLVWIMNCDTVKKKVKRIHFEWPYEIVPGIVNRFLTNMTE